jgi:hypothetical protein
VFVDRVRIVSSEKLSVVMDNDGGVKNMEVKGELSVTVGSQKLTRAQIFLECAEDGRFKFQVTDQHFL